MPVARTGAGAGTDTDTDTDTWDLKVYVYGPDRCTWWYHLLCDPMQWHLGWLRLDFFDFDFDF